MKKFYYVENNFTVETDYTNEFNIIITMSEIGNIVIMHRKLVFTLNNSFIYYYSK